MNRADLPLPAGFAERFWSKVARSEECWVWTGSRVPNGYGKVGFHHKRKGYTLHAHRVAYLLEVGDIPDGQQVCHRCDNTLCVRPDHLFVGTSHDNHVDMVAKGRARPYIARGERSVRASLTDAQALEIRQRYHAGAAPVDLARAYGVSANAINKIIAHKSWRHVGGPLPPQERRRLRGEQCAGARLTSTMVRDIRERYAAGEKRAVLAQEYGISTTYLWQIAQGLRWKHVD